MISAAPAQAQHDPDPPRPGFQPLNVSLEGGGLNFGVNLNDLFNTSATLWGGSIELDVYLGRLDGLQPGDDIRLSTRYFMDLTWTAPETEWWLTGSSTLRIDFDEPEDSFLRFRVNPQNRGFLDIFGLETRFFFRGGRAEGELDFGAPGVGAFGTATFVLGFGGDCRDSVLPGAYSCDFDTAEMTVAYRVTPVPLPSAAWFLLAGLGSLAGLRAARRNGQSGKGVNARAA
ncbi:VPLPA-CTERM sorting domain-containing protein [Rhodobaculum claviforme]|uniref:VPLPA-CTERM sorting domain-containing protein n=1 Tax=Rhodobaculum claviforme TaxID=1549854 RepID=UPI0019136B1F|nr:VPLPA-CTERM sorting domain-containing protein [Rhodobaculum claviforme]